MLSSVKLDCAKVATTDLADKVSAVTTLAVSVPVITSAAVASSTPPTALAVAWATIAVPAIVSASVSKVPSTSTSVPISKLATIRVPELGLYSNAAVSSNKAFDSLWNTTGKSVLAVESVTVTAVAKSAVSALPVKSPVTSPVKVPVKPWEVSILVSGLYVKYCAVSIPWVPVWPSTKVR